MNVINMISTDDAIIATSRTALKAFDTTKITLAYLIEAGRMGMFTWQTGDYSAQITADTQEGIYVKATAIASTSGSWVRSFTGPVNPRWFGATGDGSTDDTTAMQAAIDSGLDDILLPSDCTFIIGAAGLTGVSNQQIIGENRYTSILKLGSTPTADFIAYSSKSKFALRNLTVDWNNKTPAGNNGSITASSCDQFEIERCEIINVAKFGIMLNGARNFKIDNNHIEKNTAATSQNQAINSSVSARTAYNGKITSNLCERTAIDFAGFNSDISYNRITNWKFGAGITTEQSGDCHSLRIIGNIIDSGTGTDDNSYVCGGIENWAPWSVIADNILFSNAGAGMDQGGQHCNVHGNVCFNNGVTNNGSGISARYGDGTYNCNYSVFAHNVCFDTNTTSGTQGYGYSEQSSSVFGIKLAGNILDGNKTGNTNILSTTTSNSNDDAIEFVIDGGGSVLTTGFKGFLVVPFTCNIVQWTLLGDVSGSIVVNVWKDTYANHPPVSGDKITASAPPTISSAVKGQSSTLTGWTTLLTKGDILAFNVDSVTSIKSVALSLQVIR
jgi:hypothetical protein